MWIQTYTGRAISLLDPQPADISITDIAHALSQIVRFTGHCKKPYSVAEHCLEVSYRVQEICPCNFELRLAALLHDAHEAYIGDWSSPLKWALSSVSSEVAGVLSNVAAAHDKAIAAWAGIKPELLHDKVVKMADFALLATEKRDLMEPEPKPWLPLPLPLGVDLRNPLAPYQAAAKFKEEFSYLRNFAGLRNHRIEGAEYD